MISQGVDEETVYQIFNDGQLTTVESVFFLADLDVFHCRQAYTGEHLQEHVDQYPDSPARRPVSSVLPFPTDISAGISILAELGTLPSQCSGHRNHRLFRGNPA
jgi:hypothetical protein